MNLYKLPKGVLCNLITRISYAKDKQYKEYIAMLESENEKLHGYLRILCEMSDGDLFQFRRCSYDENNPCDAAMCCDPSGRFHSKYYKCYDMKLCYCNESWVCNKHNIPNYDEISDDIDDIDGRPSICVDCLKKA